MQGGNPGSWDVVIEKTRSSSLCRGPNSPAFRLGLRLPFPSSGRGGKKEGKKKKDASPSPIGPAAVRASVF